MKTAFEYSQTFGVDSEKHFLIVLAIGLVGVFVFKALVALWLTLFQTRFSYGVAHRLSGQMWSYHFSQSLERMRSQETGQILSEIKGWPAGFANRFMVSSLRFISEVIVIKNREARTSRAAAAPKVESSPEAESPAPAPASA